MLSRNWLHKGFSYSLHCRLVSLMLCGVSLYALLFLFITVIRILVCKYSLVSKKSK